MYVFPQIIGHISSCVFLFKPVEICPIQKDIKSQNTYGFQNIGVQILLF